MPRKLSILLLLLIASAPACSRPSAQSVLDSVRVLVTDRNGVPLPSFPVLVTLTEDDAAENLGTPLISDGQGVLHCGELAEKAERFEAKSVKLRPDVVVRDPQFVVIDLTRSPKSQYTILVPDNGSITVDLKCGLADRIGVSGKGRVTVQRPELHDEWPTDRGFLPGRDFRFEGASIDLPHVALNTSFWVWLQPANHALATVVVAEGPQNSGEGVRASVECGASETLLRARLLVNGAPLGVGELVSWSIGSPAIDGDEGPRGYGLGNCKSDGGLDIVINVARVPTETLKISYKWGSDGQARRGAVTLARDALAAGPVIDVGTVTLE